jgi:hypothetical protein
MIKNIEEITTLTAMSPDPKPTFSNTVSFCVFIGVFFSSDV